MGLILYMFRVGYKMHIFLRAGTVLAWKLIGTQIWLDHPQTNPKAQKMHDF